MFKYSGKVAALLLLLLLFNGLVNNLCHNVNSKIKKMELLSFPKETKYMYSIYWLISEIWLENSKIYFFWGGGGA